MIISLMKMDYVQILNIALKVLKDNVKNVLRDIILVTQTKFVLLKSSVKKQEEILDYVLLVQKIMLLIYLMENVNQIKKIMI